MTMRKVEHLVVDSGAFIKGAPIHEYAENIYTVDGAIKEIKDVATRQRLQFLPYKLIVKDPSPEAYKHVLEFSKKTGDFASLSVVDLQIIALTYQLEKENVGINHLHTEPCSKVSSKPCFADTQLSGFCYPKEVRIHSESESSNDFSDIDEDNKTNNEEPKDCNGQVSVENLPEENRDTEADEDDKQNENLFENDNEDLDDGWITPSNIEEMQKKMGAITVDEKSTVCVGCITTDFSIQNVLLQIGLHIVSVDGMLIKNTRVFILRCFSCFKTTTNLSKQFCANCGNKTLKRVAVSYDEQGSRNIHINYKKPINIRGMRYSLPLPKGGKHSINPILVEDQPIPHNRPSRIALQKTDASDPDYGIRSSPFAMNDVYSRAANLGIRSNKNRNQKKNPNEWSKRTGNKKRTK